MARASHTRRRAWGLKKRSFTTAMIVRGWITTASTRLERDEGDVYLVVRVDRPTWATLPTPLRPHPVAAFKPPIWNGDPERWDCWKQREISDTKQVSSNP